LSESSVDHRLVTSTTGFLRLLPEPREDVLVDPDSDSRFAGLRENRATLGAAEVVLFFHHFCSMYCFFSLRVAGRAEINRIRSLR
jgi:hypothetical protein